MQKLKTLILSLIVGVTFAGGITYAAALWQGTAWIINGETISAASLKENLDYLKEQVVGGGLWTKSGNNIYFNTGNVGVGVSFPSEKIEVNGNIKARDFLYSSDRSLKKDINTIDGLDLVMNLRGVLFKWREDNKKSIGFVAQEVEKVLPELVVTAQDSGLKSVKYANITALLVEAVKTQQKEIEALKQEVEALKKSKIKR